MPSLQDQTAPVYRDPYYLLPQPTRAISALANPFLPSPALKMTKLLPVVNRMLRIGGYN